jgi:hypothetical protein
MGATSTNVHKSCPCGNAKLAAFWGVAPKPKGLSRPSARWPRRGAHMRFAMMARAIRTTCVVTALCVVGAGAQGAQIPRIRASGPPILQVGPSCVAAGAGSVILGRNKESCLADETTAKDTLKQNWSTYPATDKTDCVILENSGGPASYVELLSCLEIIRDARGIRNADPLKSGLPAPVGTRRGKRK